MRQNLQRARKAANKTQKEIATAIGISERMYQQIETCKRVGHVRIWDALQDLLGYDQKFLRATEIQNDCITETEHTKEVVA